MAERMVRSNKGKSRQRWKDGRQLQTEILPSVPGSGHAAVLWACWFNAEITKGGVTVFDCTASQLAEMSGLSVRQVKRIMTDLTRHGVIATRRNGHNQGGRSIGAERCITWKPYATQKGDMGDTVSSKSAKPKG